MTMLCGGPPPPDFAEVDEWAINLVVSEGIWMNLSDVETVMAAGRLREKRMNSEHPTDTRCIAEYIADTLHVSVLTVEALLRRWDRMQAKIA